MAQTSANQRLLELLQSKLGNLISGITEDLGDVVVMVPRSQMLDCFQILKLDTELAFDFLVNVTAVDWLDSAADRFEVVYHLMSTNNRFRLRIKVPTGEAKPEVDSLVSMWPGADFMERECWDMYGIVFKCHPDLRRILMYDEFVGHPLRKDYPVQAKQPRIPLRFPEVRNTATDMQRPTLVHINKKSTGNSVTGMVAAK